MRWPVVGVSLCNVRSLNVFSVEAISGIIRIVQDDGFILPVVATKANLSFYLRSLLNRR